MRAIIARMHNFAYAEKCRRSMHGTCKCQFFVSPDATVESHRLKLLSTQGPECRGNERRIRGRGEKGIVTVSMEGEFL